LYFWEHATMQVPDLHTPRLSIRPLVMADRSAIHRVLHRAFDEADELDDVQALAERRSWLEWTLLSYEWHARLHQPPYGERGVVLRSSGELIGTVGYVPSFDAFGQIPALSTDGTAPGVLTPEFGLFWAVEPEQQGQGYATEAARAMIAYAFEHLRARRVVATTEHSNLASQAVMRKLGMTLVHNPLPDPPWLQVVGVLVNPLDATAR
jgi:[ribosomal protein S5]-alanine N-acetyltransferase